MNRKYSHIIFLGTLLILLSINGLFHGDPKGMIAHDPVMYIYAPVIKASGYVSFSAGNYDGVPVVIYQASTLYMPSGR